MEDKYTFKQALVMSVIGLIPALIAAFLASSAASEAEKSKDEADKINKNAVVRQARMDERDLMLASLKEGTGFAFMIPLENDNAWRLYLKCRDEGQSRRSCSNENKEAILKGLTTPNVATPLK